jgi:hypothetical protein
VTGTLENGDCSAGEILGTNDLSLVDQYSISISAPTTITASLNSDDFDAFLRILDSENNIVAEDDDSGAQFNAEIVTSLNQGTYKFLINSATSSSQTGIYSFSVSGEVPHTGSSKIINIATRAEIGTGDDLLIGGLVIGGSTPKTVLIRAIGPALAEAGVGGALLDPQLRLFKGSDVIDSNDDWSDHPRAGDIPGHLQPRFPLESAILTTLDPGPYTAIINGLNESTGVGLVEIYEVDGNESAKLINIATRGRVKTGDKVMIGGLVITGDASKSVLVRALGPSLADAGVSGTLNNPMVRLFNSSGVVIDSNDNWRSHPNSGSIPNHLLPKSEMEAAISTRLEPGAYTAIVTGVSDNEGVAIVEVYELE